MQALNKIRNRVTGRKLITVTVIFVVLIVVMNILAAILTQSTGVQLLDYALDDTHSKGYETIGKLGSDGRNFYLILLSIDFLFPVVYMIFGVSLLGYLLNRFATKDSLLNLLILLPVLGMLCDWVENVMIVSMINIFPNELPWLADIGSVSTKLKFMFLGATLLLAFVLWLVGFFKTRTGYLAKEQK